MIVVHEARFSGAPSDTERRQVQWTDRLFLEIHGWTNNGWICDLDNEPVCIDSYCQKPSFVVAQVPAGLGLRPGYYGISYSFEQALAFAQ